MAAPRPVPLSQLAPGQPPTALVLPGGTRENPLLMGRPGLPRVLSVPLTLLRSGAMRSLEHAQRTTAPVSVVSEVDMGRTQDVYRRAKQILTTMGVPFTYTALFARATIKALQAWPLMNGAVTERGYVIPRYVDLGVATQVPGAVVISVVRGAESKTIPDLARELYINAERAKRGQMTEAELGGQTFVITNPGSYGVSLFGTPTIAAGNTGILSFEKIQKRPVVTPDDRIVARPMMYMVLSADHRAVDGYDMIGFLAEVKRILETADF